MDKIHNIASIPETRSSLLEAMKKGNKHEKLEEAITRIIWEIVAEKSTTKKSLRKLLGQLPKMSQELRKKVDDIVRIGIDYNLEIIRMLEKIPHISGLGSLDTGRIVLCNFIKKCQHPETLRKILIYIVRFHDKGNDQDLKIRDYASILKEIEHRIGDLGYSFTGNATKITFFSDGKQVDINIKTDIIPTPSPEPLSP